MIRLLYIPPKTLELQSYAATNAVLTNVREISNRTRQKHECHSVKAGLHDLDDVIRWPESVSKSYDSRPIFNSRH